MTAFERTSQKIDEWTEIKKERLDALSGVVSMDFIAALEKEEMTREEWDLVRSYFVAYGSLSHHKSDMKWMIKQQDEKLGK